MKNRGTILMAVVTEAIDGTGITRPASATCTRAGTAITRSNQVGEGGGRQDREQMHRHPLQKFGE